MKQLDNYFHYYFYIFYKASIKNTFKIGAVIYSSCIISISIGLSFMIFQWLLIIFIPNLRQILNIYILNISLTIHIVLILFNLLYFTYGDKYKKIIEYYDSIKKINLLEILKYALIPIILFIINTALVLYARVNINHIPIKL